MYQNYNQGLANQIIKVHTKLHQTRSATATPRRMMDKNDIKIKITNKFCKVHKKN